MKEEERKAITMRLVGMPLTDDQIDVAEAVAAKMLAEAFTMKLCKDCKHRKWTFTLMDWVCRAGEHVPKQMITDPVTGKIKPRYPGFAHAHPRCEYMREKDHSFVLHQCGPLGGMWEAKK
jgi:hypothetical protein